jgi:DNA-binding NarL/FixJ family response regulator
VVALRVARGSRRPTDPDAAPRRIGSLSNRERDVVRLLSRGASGPEIADELHVAHNTVRTHVRNAMTKLGARSRAQLVAMSLADGHALDWFGRESRNCGMTAAHLRVTPGACPRSPFWSSTTLRCFASWLLDIHLPDADGFEVAAAITSVSGSPAVLMMTADPHLASYAMVGQSGARGLVGKADLCRTDLSEFWPAL